MRLKIRLGGEKSGLSTKRRWCENVLATCRQRTYAGLLSQISLFLNIEQCIMAPIATSDLIEVDYYPVGATKNFSGLTGPPIRAPEHEIKVWQLDRKEVDEIEGALHIFLG